MNTQELLRNVDELIRESRELKEEGRAMAQAGKEITLDPVPVFKVYCSTLSLLDYLGAETHARILKEYMQQQINAGVMEGILRSAKREIVNGLILRRKVIVTADVMDDMLEQAEYLLDNEYKDAACVLVGGALESILRSMVENTEGVVVKDGLKKLNERLHKASVYDKVTFHQIEAWTDLRNHAAHGEYNYVVKESVRDFLSFTRMFISSQFAPKFTMI